MIRIHHLNESRSQRIVWLLEELDVPYEIIAYERDPETRLAPRTLTAVHPLGKSPVLEDASVRIAESGAIIEYLAATYADGRLGRPFGSEEWPAYIEWLHYAEGSAMLPLMMKLYVSRLGDAGAPLHSRIEGQIASHLDFLAGAMDGRMFLLGDSLTGARHPDQFCSGSGSKICSA